MKYFFHIFFFILCYTQINAQEKHFLFIQSDNKQPFYISVNNKLFSSSASGYVIIPKLAEGSYNFSVGFAQNAFPEQNFQLLVDKKDLGYNLKNFTEKGWGLFNLQTLDITMAGSSNTSNVAKALLESEKKSAGEPVLTFKKKAETVALPVAVSETRPNANPADSKAPVADTMAVVKVNNDTVSQVPVASLNKEEDNPAGLQNLSDVKKVSEVKGADGVKLSYIETTGKTNDTIQVIIPTAVNSASGTVNNADTQTSGNPLNAVPTTGSTSNKEVKFLDMDMDSSKKDRGQAEKKPEETSVATVSNNCKDIATEEDYGKLRKKMANETTDEDMIAEAKKFYKNKCFTTSQVKALSTLFLSDEGRFKFFESSYSSVADANQYSSLQTEFIDPAFVNRLKALVQ